MATSTLSGALESFGTIHLIRLLQDTRVTGRIEFARGDERVNLFVERGRSVVCTSTQARLRVGEILVLHGDLQPDVVDLALAVQSDRPGERIGHILVDSGSVSEPQVRDAVRVLQRQILFDVLLWREGTFQFHPGELAPDVDVRLEMDVDRLVIGLLALASEVLQRQADRDAA